MKSWIYFARHGTDGPIKIGHAYDPRVRVMSLAIGSPVPIVLLGAVLSERAKEEEAEIHACLREHCVRGEWFQGEAVLHEMKRLEDRMVAPEALKSQETSNDALNANFNIRVLPEEAVAWKTAAKRAGMSVSQWVRNQLDAAAVEAAETETV